MIVRLDTLRRAGPHRGNASRPVRRKAPLVRGARADERDLGGDRARGPSRSRGPESSVPMPRPRSSIATKTRHRSQARHALSLPTRRAHGRRGSLPRRPPDRSERCRACARGAGRRPSARCRRSFSAALRCRHHPAQQASGRRPCPASRSGCRTSGSARTTGTRRSTGSPRASARCPRPSPRTR